MHKIKNQWIEIKCTVRYLTCVWMVGVIKKKKKPNVTEQDGVNDAWDSTRCVTSNQNAPSYQGRQWALGSPVWAGFVVVLFDQRQIWVCRF